MDLHSRFVASVLGLFSARLSGWYTKQKSKLTSVHLAATNSTTVSDSGAPNSNTNNHHTVDFVEDDVYPEEMRDGAQEGAWPKNQ